MGSRLAVVGRFRALHVPRPLPLGLSSSSSFDTENVGKLPWGNGMGGATDSKSPATSGIGMSLRSAREQPWDDPPAGESADARRRIGDERVHDGRAVQAPAPLEGGGDAILQLVSAVRQPRHVTRGQLHGEPVDGSDHGPRAEEGARHGEPEGSEQLSEHERHQGRAAPANNPRRP